MEKSYFPWEQKAMRGEDMPDGLSLPEQCAYQALAHLYGRYRLGLISREKGSAEKGKIKYEFRKHSEAQKFAHKMAEWNANFWKSIEYAHGRYLKNKTLENADLLSDAVDGELRKWEDL